MTNGADAQPPGEIDDKGFFGHPMGLSVLFFSELWERFSFYGMRALLTLYMVKELGYPKDPRAYGVYGSYGALVYAFPVVGGWLANKWLGYRRAIILGGIFMALGHFTMAVPAIPLPFSEGANNLIYEMSFYLALGLLCVGNGFFKPNISSTVGRLYKPDDSRRDRGFTIFYMGINMGALLAPLVCGQFQGAGDWHIGFSIAGFGMLLGLIWFVRGQRHIGTHGEPENPDLLNQNVLAGLSLYWSVIVAAVLVVPLAAMSLYYYEVGGYVIQGVTVVVLIALIGFTVQLEGVARLRMIALIVLMFFHFLFWAAFEQAGTSLTVLTDAHVRRNVGGSLINASTMQFVNPTFIVICAPLISTIWKIMARKGWEPSVPMKFALGLIQLGLGYLVLVWGLTQTDSLVSVALFWLIFCYLLHTTGELCLSPVGLSAVTKLSPTKWVGFCMGAWFLTIANAHLGAAAIAQMTAAKDPAKGSATATTAAEIDDQVGMITRRNVIGKLTFEAEKKAGETSEADGEPVKIEFFSEARLSKDQLPAIVEEYKKEKVSREVVLSWKESRIEILKQITAASPLAAVAAHHSIDASELPQWEEWTVVLLEQASRAVEPEDQAEREKNLDTVAAAFGVTRDKILKERQNSVEKYLTVFKLVAYIVIGAGILLMLMTPFLKKLMSGVN